MVTKSERIVRAMPYGEALFHLCRDRGITRPDIERMYEYAADLRNHHTLLVLADSAVVSADVLAKIFKQYAIVFGDELLFHRLIAILHRHRLFPLIPDIIEYVASLLAQRISLGIYTCSSATNLDSARREQIDQRVRSFGGYRDTLPIYRVDESLIAGFVIKSNDGWSADYSVRGSLQAVADRLTREGLL
jgi:F0F1-type ATP synthase delta subunit